MSKYWNKTIQRLSPYVAGEQPQDQQYIKLNTNESPIKPSKAVHEAMHAAVENDLNLYPDPNCSDLKKQIAECYKVSIDNVFVGNGSDEVLAHIFAGLFDHDKALICPDISYGFYPTYACLYNIKLQQIPLSNTFEINLEEYPAENGGVIFANPNAPTSIALGLDEIKTFLQRNQSSVVVVDEAYVDFGARSCIELISQFDNLIVVQTLSKSRSLAGLRVGYAIGAPALIEGLERVKNSFNAYPLDKIALAGAQAAIKDKSALQASVNEIISNRQYTRKALTQMAFTVLESTTNFLFVSPQFIAAEALYLRLKEAGILVRYFNAPRIDQYLRITIGTKPEMQLLIETISKIKS